MKYHPTKVINLILYFFILTIIVACSKDIDILSDAVLNDSVASVEERENSEEAEEEEEEAESQEEEQPETPEEEPPAEDGMEDGFESRTTEFPPVDDAHVQSGKGYNQTIIRLDENNRTSYLKFDLSAIEAIGGYITDASLKFTVNSDEGNGTINIYKGVDSDWTEQEIDNINVPDIDILLGAITKEFKIGNTEEVTLSGSDLIPENTTLILQHEEGNDLAIASKEHPSKIGPKLVISYNVPETAEPIIIIEEEPAPPAEENSSEEENTPAENQAPIAIADATPSSGGVPLDVSFTGSNSTDDNEITTYAWDFKDGGTSSSANPSHTFNNVGSYEVELTVTDAEGLTSTDTVTITVNEESNEAPVARATGSPLSGTAPLEVAFTGSNSSDDNSVASYSWNFKDGSTANNANPTHTFNNAGTYAVELTVTDENGLSDKETVNITVNAPPSNEAPVAVASANPLSGDAPLQVSFVGSNSSDDNGIVSYYWDFPGDPSAATNATRTFNTPGVYDITLTVKDAAGLAHSDTVTITVTQGSGGNTGGGGNAPPGYYVTTSGSAGNSGLSESSAWSIEHAFDVAKPGDIIYVKAGNYGNKQLRLDDRLNSVSNPTKFIGYTNTPGDLVSSGGSTFSYGNSLNPSKMPLIISSSPNQGAAINIFEENVEIENFQISGYSNGLLTQSIADDFKAKNIIVLNSGNQNSNGYDGVGLNIRGSNSVLENCFVLNATAEAIKLTGAHNSRVRNCKVYADNATNPTDYYFLLAGGITNTVVENCYAERAQGLSHGGHGFIIKNDGTYNTFLNCVARRTNFELSYPGVHHNTINGGAVRGVSTSSGEWHSRVLINNGAHHNTIKNMEITDTWAAIALSTYFDSTGADASLGNDNVFENITIDNTYSALRIGGDSNYSAEGKRYDFINCNISNFTAVSVVHFRTEDFEFRNCNFSNGDYLEIEVQGVYAPYSSFNPSYVNCTWTNVNFNPPN
ncbi:PKD domain-containing protein [Muriicola sp. Z0-33]|uniref:PKD domain-containing protein n=1 Tax=Muriicola sp. Z0-33 TaxID=2816957 RepID=UPI0022382247|nr:PKD domain-containing protein [Muriicola sp. Z0-33]MCW5515589.1 PKD domain-containing protein [Muriicola sp. Z0-33]